MLPDYSVTITVTSSGADPEVGIEVAWQMAEGVEDYKNDDPDFRPAAFMVADAALQLMNELSVGGLEFEGEEERTLN